MNIGEHISSRMRDSKGGGARRARLANMLCYQLPTAVLALLWCLLPLLLQPASTVSVASSRQVVCIQLLPGGVTPFTSRTGAAGRSSGGAVISGYGPNPTLLPNAPAGNGPGDKGPSHASAVLPCTVGWHDATLIEPITDTHPIAECARRGMRTAGRDPPLA